MLNLYNDVRTFHRVGGVACPEKIAFPDESTIALRQRLNREEVTETNDALAARDMLEAADGIIDSIYVLLGNAIALGITQKCFEDLWSEVQRSNLKKFVWDEQARSWTVYKDAEGKITKPPAWKPPDIAGVLRRHGWDPSAPAPPKTSP